ncbi:MAG: metalloregulator ArsR/SmtB family transcription factor [Microbacterium sp.]|uniref:metalloregulator ArsR/SmtB family transcription factor n=1 Tax=Microbacterium sp. TaxID=51671 RepID=UPI0026242DFC|nr:metalloregulator ArsR/SmtB family transcription factor [Microbacterium sp.]MCX6503375.1 metalloregulator ArsR/SmtB family transcription factor [Microbacterium sp.]
MTMTTPLDCAPTTAHAMGEPAAATLAATLKSLADPLRVRMLSAISSDPRGEACVCDLEQLSAVSQPTISHHLKVMRDAGVLESERRGTWVYYRITPRLRPAVTTLLDSFAPAAVSAPERTGEGLSDVDGQLTRIAGELQELHPALDAQLILHVVRESYAGLARRATVSSLLIPLAERFARQRLDDLSRDRTAGAARVLFVCVANAGRSQLAAALVNQRSGGRVIARSAGSSPAGEVHPHVRSLIAEIDPASSVDAYPKPLTDDAVRAADIVVTMGCGDVCPVIPGVRYEDWAVGDPALASPEGVAAIRDDIAQHVDRLLATL